MTAFLCRGSFQYNFSPWIHMWHWELSYHDANYVLTTPEVAIAASDDKVGIMTIIMFQWMFCIIQIWTRTTRTPALWGYPPPSHDYPHYWIPSQKNNRSRTENVTEQTQFSKSRSNDLEDIGQGQRSSHAAHLLMLVIICTKYGKNPSRTVDATERTPFSRSTPMTLKI